MDTSLRDQTDGGEEEGFFSQITVAANTLWDKLELVKAKTSGIRQLTE